MFYHFYNIANFYFNFYFLFLEVLKHYIIELKLTVKMNFFCFICGASFHELKHVINHLKLIEHIKEGANTQIKCVINYGCKNTFATFSGLRNHIKKHTLSLTNSTETPIIIPLKTTALSSRTQNNNNLNESKNYINKEGIKGDFKNLYITMNQLGLPETSITKILLQTESLIKNVLISKCDVDEFEKLVRPYCSKYIRREALKNNVYYVAPEEIPVGHRWETKFNRSTGDYKKIIVQNRFIFIPITQTIKKLFLNIHFRSLFKEHQESHNCETSVYKYPCCGSSFQSLPEKVKKNSFLQLQLYYDDFEVAKVLGSKVIIHKIGAMYFNFHNVPNIIKSNLSSIFLVALFYTNDIRNSFNLNHILAPVVSDIKILETQGITVDEIGLLFGTVVNLSHDNLAANEIIGFTKSFSAHYFCRFCTMNKSDTKYNTTENKLLLRNVDCYNILKTQNNIMKINLSKTKGIYRKSVLNDLNFFNTINNNSVDLMHDGLEGFVTLILKFMIEFFLEQKIFNDINKLNDCISEYNFGYIDRRNKTSNINIDKSNLGQYAIQILCLACHFPLIFGRFYKKEHANQWGGVTTMLQILEILFCNEVKEAAIVKLENLISNHLNIIINIFKKTLTPKQHFLTHYPSVIRRIGPIIHTWTMRFESKHRYFTKIKIQNYINVCKSLSERHQEMIASFWENCDFKREVIRGKKKLFIQTLDINDYSSHSVVYTLNFFEHIWHYKIGFFLLKEFVNENVVYFYKIIQIFEIDNEVHFSTSEFIGIYDTFYCGYHVFEKPNAFKKLIKYKEIRHKPSFCQHFCNANNKNYILSIKVHEFL